MPQMAKTSPSDPYGVAAERRQQRERFAAQKAAAEQRHPDDPRAHAFTPGEIEALVLQEAKREGAFYGGVTAAVSGAAVLAANTFKKTFRRRLGVSGKMALVVMPTVAAAALSAELFINESRRNKQKFLDNYLGIERPKAVQEPAKDLALWKRAANTLYEYPYYTLGLSGTAAVATVFSLQPKELTFQQKVLHSRVMGQMSVLGILCVVMGFTDYMRRRGGPFTA